MLRIQALGALQVFTTGQRPLSLPARKVQALLAWLALHPGRPQPRARLATLLWSDSAEAPARASLRQALVVLRRACALTETELIAGDTIALAPGVVEVDALEFERLLADGSAGALEAAAALYGGDLLEALEVREPAFDEWLAAERQRLRERALDALQRLLAERTHAGRIDRAIDAALRLLALDPLQEAVHRSLMQLYAHQGRPASASRQYQLCRDVLGRELGTRPQAATVQLHDAIVQDRHGAAPAPAGPAPADELELRSVAVLSVAPAAAAEEADPEQACALQGQRSERAAALVARFGGTLPPRTDGQQVAVFGAVRAHGDDLERAARCALRWRDEGDAAHFGLALGTALVRRAHGRGDDAVAVTGDVVAAAMRLAAAAAAGEVLVSPGTWRALAPAAEGSRCSAAALPASLRAGGAWRLAALRVHGPQRVALVGRRAELRQFAGALDACVGDRRGLALHVRGEPGIGKTRLAEEFVALASQRGFACHVGSVLDVGAGAQHDAMRAIVHGLLGGTADVAAGPGDAVARALAAGLVDPGDEPLLFDLLQQAMPPAAHALFDAMDPATRQRAQAGALDRLLQRCSAQAPRLLVVEDLHWAPPGLLGQVAALARAAEASAALLVTTTRSDGDPLNTAWRAQAGLGALLTFDLGPLQWDDASALAAEWGGGDDARTLRCVERAGGNALFLGQLLREAPDAQAALPLTVQSVVQARLDRLAPAQRQAIRRASVLGQRFALDALAALQGDAAVGLAVAPAFGGLGLVHVEGDEGVFAHALVREAAYASLPRAQRRDLHATAARWFATRDALLRAEHLDLAEDPGAAAAWLDAAREQAALQHPERAVALADRGLALPAEAALRSELARCKADALHDLGSMAGAQSAYEEALAAAPDAAARCRALIGLANVLRVRDALEAAADALRLAEEQARALPSADEPLARIHLLRGNLLFPRGDLDGCQREHALSLAHARAAGSIELEVAALGGLGDADFLRGHMLAARSRFGECVALAQRHGLQRVEAANRPMAAMARWYAGDGRGALGDARSAIELAARIGHRRAEAIAHHGAYQFSHALMAFDDALHHAERSLAIAQQLGAPRFEAEALAFRGELLRTLGQREPALVELRRALALARSSGMDYLGPVYLGMLAAATGDAAERDAALAEGEALLVTNGLAHNHLLFRRDAIDACIGAANPVEALRHAALLEARTREQPLPWSSFFVARARLLASGADHAARAALSAQGERLGLRVACRALDAPRAAPA